MVAQTRNAGSSKANVGRALLWVGSLVFLAETWVLFRWLGEFWQSSGASAFGWVAALGTAVQKSAAALAWNQGVVLAAAVKVLVLCCPLVVVAVGIAMLRKAAVSEAMEQAVCEATPAKERR